MTIVYPIFLLPEGQTAPTNFDAWFDHYDDGVSRKLHFHDIATTVAKLKSVLGRCQDHPDCVRCGAAGEHPMVRIGWNLSGFFRSVEFRFESCVNGNLEEVPATVYATTNEALLEVVTSLDVTRTSFGDEDLHNDIDDDDDAQAATMSSYSSDAIAGSLPNLKVFEYVDVAPDEVDAAKRIHAVMTRCHDLENIWICGSSESYWENPFPQDFEQVQEFARLLEDAFRQPETRNSLKIVRFTNTYFSDEEMARLITVLSSIRSIERVNLQGNVCGPLAMEALRTWFQRKNNDDDDGSDDGACKLRHLNMSNTFSARIPLPPAVVAETPLTGSFGLDLVPLASILQTNNNSLKELIIDETALNECAVDSICEMLVNNSTIETMSMKGETLTAEGVESIAKALPRIDGLRSLDLSDIVDLTQEALDALGEGLAANTSLRRLYLRGLGSNRPNHLQSLFCAFDQNTTLKELHVSNHDMSDSVDTMATLALMLTRNATAASLEKIDLSSCRLGDLGLACFALQIPRMTSLKSLDLSWNEYSFGAISALLTGMKNNFTITELVVDASHRYRKEYGLIQFYLGMNRNGRRVLGTDLPMSLWPLVLARVEDYDEYAGYTGNNDMIPSVFYMFLRNEILLTRCSGTDTGGLVTLSGRKRKVCDDG
jgi:Ran GTPase-activating protein (RanGAP) involved in mRNA processing and transport